MAKQNNFKEPGPELQVINYTGNKGPLIGTRHIQVIGAAITVALGFATKTMLSVAIVAMTDAKGSSNPNVPTYDWNNKSVIISSILWSGIAVNLLSGYLAKQYGAKWIIFISSLLNSGIFMLIPLSASFAGSTGVIVCRILQGIALGFLLPLNTVVVGTWVPPEERSRLGFVGAGFITLMITISSIATGYIADSSLGWPWIFYIFGGIGIAWSLIYAFIGVQSPEAHKRISPEEKKYILDTLFQTHDKNSTPWVQIFTSIHFWAVVLGQTGYGWIIIMLSTETSIFLSAVMEFDLKTTGTVTAIPTFVALISGVGLSTLSDLIVKRKIISVINSRRTFQTIGMTGVSLSLILMTFVPVDYKAWSVVLLCIGNFFVIHASVGGASINILDLSPKYAGITMGFSQMLSQAVSLFAPLMVQWICTDETDASQWRTVFIASAAISMSTTIFFDIFASDQRQNWDRETDLEAKIEIQKRKSSIISISAGIGP